jgi:hypothetical protein
MRKIYKILICVNLCNLWFILASAPLKAIPPRDTTKQQYALNDPRNPDCPCHKYQKLAENEYAELLNKKYTLNKSKNKRHSKSFFEMFFNRKKMTTRSRWKGRKHKNRTNLCYKF